MRLALCNSLLQVPEDARTAADRAFLADINNIARVNIIHLVHQKKVYEGHSQDHEFSGTSMREHWRAGLEDTRRTLAHRDWLDLPSEDVGVVVHDIHRGYPT